MKILIVEDDENKSRNLIDFLSISEVDSEIKIEKSLRSGIGAVIDWHPNLILLDMTMPTYDIGPEEHGGKPQIFGGRELMAQMVRFDISIPVIVVTQFETFGQGNESIDLEELNKKLREEFPDFYRGAVYYHAAVEGWQEKIQQMISQI